MVVVGPQTLEGRCAHTIKHYLLKRRDIERAMGRARTVRREADFVIGALLQFFVVDTQLVNMTQSR
jgi:hypothetical protein